MILITGSTGFVGMNLLKKLSEGNSKIIALYRCEQKKRLVEKFLKFSKSTNKNIIWKKSTINDIISLEEAFAGVTKVYHCAGYISFSANEKEKLNSVNINGTKNIVNLCINKKILKLIYFSSISALGDELNENRINENTNYTNFHQQTPYSYSKYNAELEVWRGIQEGLKSVIINPGIILGKSVRNDAPQSKIEKMILKYPFCFYAKGKSGFVYIDDVISASLKLMNSSRAFSACSLVIIPKVAQVSRSSAFTVRTISRTRSKSALSLTCRQAAPMQNRVAPAACAALADSNTVSLSKTSVTSTLVLKRTLWGQ